MGQKNALTFLEQQNLMVELEYVKKRKKKKLAGIIAAIGSLGIGVFVLVSFLGRFVGTFTVSLNTGAVKLSLYRNSKYDEPTSYIKIDSLPPFDLVTYSKLPAAKDIDTEEAGVDSGTTNNGQVMNYFKYTFFVRNEGNVTADYEVKINITKNEPSTSDRYGVRYLDQILRVMVYQNDANTDEHNFSVFAKASEHPNPTGNGDETTFKEYLSDKYDPIKNPNPVFAEPFEDSNTVTTIVDPKFESGDVKRYTVVAWLEGADPQAYGEAPEGANLKLGVTINAYENK